MTMTETAPSTRPKSFTVVLESTHEPQTIRADRFEVIDGNYAFWRKDGAGPEECVASFPVGRTESVLRSDAGDVLEEGPVGWESPACGDEPTLELHISVWKQLDNPPSWRAQVVHDRRAFPGLHDEKVLIESQDEEMAAVVDWVRVLVLGAVNGTGEIPHPATCSLEGCGDAGTIRSATVLPLLGGHVVTEYVVDE